MTSPTLTYDADAKALYIQLIDADVLETLEVAHEGNPLVDEDQARVGQIEDLPQNIHAGRRVASVRLRDQHES